MWRYLIAALLALHGLVHTVGFLAAWQLRAIAGVTATPSFPTLDAGATPVLALGSLWLVAGAGFIVGGTGLATQTPWWIPVTAFAALLSLVLATMWWQSAPIGIAIDVAVLGFLLIATRGRGGAWLRKEGIPT